MEHPLHFISPYNFIPLINDNSRTVIRLSLSLLDLRYTLLSAPSRVSSAWRTSRCDAASGHVNMYVVVLEELLIHAKRRRVGTHPGQSGLHGLLHHLTDLSGHGEAAFALHLVGFDKEDVATGWRPGEADSNAGTPRTFGNLRINADLDAAQEFLHDRGRHDQLVRLAFGDPTRLLAAHGPDIAFQIAYAGFTRVMTADEAHRVFRNLNLLPGQTVFFDLLGNQITLGNVYLVVFRVALELDDLHAVAQRLGNRVEHVRRTD